VYVITGGLGGIGLTLARWLATQTSARLLLTARTPLPPREDWDAWLAGHSPDDRSAQAIRAIRDLEQAGGEVLVSAADAADEAAMRRAIDAARARWGRIDGVIHAAGISGNDRVAFLKQTGDVQAVLAPKVDGLAVLVRLLGDTPLDFVALLSTISTVLPGAGVCDYAAANAVLDAFVDCEARPRSWRRVVALNYGPWRDVGMAARLFEARAKDRDEFLRWAISPSDGAEAFARVLASGRSRVVVAPFDLLHSMDVLREQVRVSVAADASAAIEPAAPAAPPPQERPAVSASYEAPANDVELRLAAIWSELLGVDRIGAHDDFFELGGHSLLATRVLARIDQALAARLSLRDVFDAPTIRLLSQRVSAASRGASRPAPPADDREELEF
jgi:NAD(P)-dependent dehydrogenase (short-subunit alcohol dehydrogenase family)